MNIETSRSRLSQQFVNAPYVAQESYSYGRIIFRDGQPSTNLQTVCVCTLFVLYSARVLDLSRSREVEKIDAVGNREFSTFSPSR